MNAQLVSALEELREISDILGRVYREKAYRKAIAGVRGLNYQITPDNLPDLSGAKIPGVGEGILEKIVEFVISGQIAELVSLRGDPTIRAYRELSKIIGVGPKTIEKWIGLGINSLAKLRRAVASGKITLNNMQKWGLRYYDDLNERIPRAETSTLSDHVKGILLQLDPNIIFTVSGSYRRGAVTSGDIDILISNRSHYDETLLETFIEIIHEDPNFIDVIFGGDERITFLYKSPISGKVRQIDILYIAYGSYYAALNYFTGGWAHNEMLRGVAKSKGYRLNQAGLYKYTGKGKKKLELVPTHSEQEIYKILGVDYIPPERRQ